MRRVRPSFIPGLVFREIDFTGPLKVISLVMDVSEIMAGCFG